MNSLGSRVLNTKGSTLWLKADLRSKCEFLNTSHLLIEGYILEIGHGKTEYSLTIYLTTKKNFSHIGATCAQETKTCARGRFRRFRILKRILEIGHGKTKYSLTIYLISIGKLFVLSFSENPGNCLFSKSTAPWVPFGAKNTYILLVLVTKKFLI